MNFHSFLVGAVAYFKRPPERSTLSAFCGGGGRGPGLEVDELKVKMFNLFLYLHHFMKPVG